MSENKEVEKSFPRGFGMKVEDDGEHVKRYLFCGEHIEQMTKFEMVYWLQRMVHDIFAAEKPLFNGDDKCPESAS